VIDNPNPTIVGYLCNTTARVRLLGNPLSPLTLSAVPSNAAISANPSQLTFDSSNWSQYQPITILSGEVSGDVTLRVSGPSGINPQTTDFTVIGGPYCQ
jgi:hypothetical protein